MPAPIERIEGKYEILEKMQEGGMGAVYKVRHRHLDEIRVIKVMRPHLAQDETLRERFKREAKTAIKLRHQNLAQLYDFTVDEDGNAFIVMEFIDGINLLEVMKALGRPSIPMALEVARQSLDVIGYLHFKRIIHRDISPDNIMLSRDEDGSPLVKLIDLGIAKETQSDSGLTVAGTFLGKVRYASPEQLKTQEGCNVQEQSDLYSFGIVLYQMLTRKYPIRGDSTTAVIAGHLMHPPIPFDKTDPKGTVPDPLRELVMSSLGKTPAERPRNAKEFLKEIEEIQTEFPFDTRDLGRVLNGPRQETQRIKVPKPGSTQDHLDRQFGIGTTPPPDKIRKPKKKTPPPLPKSTERDQSQQIRALLLGAEKLIEAQHYDEARVQLQAARELDPGNSEVKRLSDTIDRLDQKQKRRRLEAAEKVKALVDAGSLDRAQQEFDQALESLGSDAELDAAGGLVERARAEAEARAQEAKKAYAKAQAAVEEDDLEKAEQLFGKVLELAPDHTDAAAQLDVVKSRLAQLAEEERKQQEIVETCREISVQIERGDLDDADRALAVARKVYGALPEFDALETARRKARIEGITKKAAALIAADDHEGAIDLLSKAKQQVGETGVFSTLLDEAQTKLRKRREEERRRDAIQIGVESIERLVLTGRFETAYRSLEQLITEHGQFDDAETLRSQIESAIELRREQEQQAYTYLEQARSALDDNDFDSARTAIEAAQNLDLDNPTVNGLIDQTEAELTTRLHTDRRVREVTKATQSISERIEAGQFEEAERELQVAERLFSDEKELSRLRSQLEELKTSDRQEKVEALVREALTQHTSFPDVIATLEQAFELDPGNAKVQRLLSETKAAHSRFLQERRSQAIAESMETIDQLIAEGRMKEALQALDETVQEVGEFADAKTLRARLERAVKG